MSRNNSDSAWKDVLDAYLKQCVDYCFPLLSQLIDWNKPLLSLDKELQAITKSSASKKSLLDKLFQVHLKEGGKQWILLHVEVQGEYDETFAQRMFTYAYRIFDRYERAIVSCAILTDNQKTWRPNYYKIGLAGSYLASKFLTVKLLDFAPQWHSLEKSSNPFACIIVSQLAALESKYASDKEKKEVKFALTKRLYEKNYTKSQIKTLYRFIDWLIGLPESFEIEYINEVYQLEESQNMAYVCTAERLGIKKGKEIGMEEGREKGREEGIEQGIEQGQQMAMKKMALFLIKKGFSLNEIISETGLTFVEINKLREKISISV